jgi:hypothetical protein
MNIKESAKEVKMKVLVWLSNHFKNNKSFRQMTKQEILDYLNVYANQSISNDPSFCLFINWHVLFSNRIKVHGLNAKNHLLPTT